MSTLTDIKPLAIEEWDHALSHILEDMKQRPLNVHSLMAHHPDLLKAWWNFRNYSVVGGDLGKRKGEIVILRTAHHLKAWYEWGAHVERGLASGLTLSEINDVRSDVKGMLFDTDEKLIIQIVDELFKNQSITSETLEKAAPYFSKKQIMDIMAIHGMYMILGGMIKTWGLELEYYVLEKLPESVTKEAFLNFEK